MTHFSVEQTAEILDLPPSIVDKLVRSGQLPSDGDGVPAEQIQNYLSQSFIRLFRMQAVEDAQATLPVEDHDPLITRSIAEYETELRDNAAEMRVAPRYVPRRQLGGTYRDIRFTLMQLSTTGLRIRHDET